VDWFQEDLHKDKLNNGYAQRIEIRKVIYQDKSKFQDLLIFETPTFGRVLALDGVIQTTEKDEFCYHEMLTHVPLFAHGKATRVLVIGGGDGGVLREVLRHENIKNATLVELDRSVIDACVEHMPTLSNGAFDDSRTDVIITDGVQFVEDCPSGSFDLIVVDSTDPLGPGEVLFSETFYRDCKRCLDDGGVFVNQNGVPAFQPGEVTTTYQRLIPLFEDVSFYLTVVPTYIGGFMAIGWATEDSTLRNISLQDLRVRFEASSITTNYYTPDLHTAAFSLPPFISRLMHLQNS
jgi:spermidine synthase